MIWTLIYFGAGIVVGVGVGFVVGAKASTRTPGRRTISEAELQDWTKWY